MSEMLNFLGALQPVKPIIKTGRALCKSTSLAKTDYEALPRVSGRGQCISQEDAKRQLKALYKREYPQYADFVDNDKLCFGGVLVFDCTPYELIEKTANDESADIVRQMYEDSVELSPFI